MHINKVIDEINVQRNLGSSNQCYEVMYTIARSYQVTRIVEIGTHKGASAITFCQAVLDNHKIPSVYTVDNWIQADKRAEAINNFAKAQVCKYITMVNGDSKIVVPQLFNDIGKVELTFIDGDHEEDNVEIDYDNCKNYSNLILFHDTGYGSNKYLNKAKAEGWNLTVFPTRYVEGDGHLVGISLISKYQFPFQQQ
jgi:tRNA A58 N-methylase Trm61